MNTDRGTHDTQRRPAVDAAVGETRTASEQTVIPVLDEQLDVHTRRVETDAGVRVTKTIDEREETVDVPLTKEDVEVERVAINRAVDAPLSVRHEGDTMIIPIVEEVLVVEKRLMLKEEIRVTRRRHEVREPQRVTLKSEHAEVERIGESTVAEGDARGSATRATSSALERDAATDLLEQKRRQDDARRRELGSSS